MKKALFLLLALILVFAMCGCNELSSILNNSSSENISSIKEDSSQDSDNSPGTVWESAKQRIIIEYNKNQKHKCYLLSGSQIEYEYYIKIDQESKVITFYSAEEMREDQMVSTERWNIKGGSFTGEKVNIETVVSDHYNDPDRVISLYNKGRNTVNDPDIPLEQAKKIANKTFKEGNYEVLEYKGIEKRGIKQYYSFHAYRNETHHFHHKIQSWIYIDMKTGEMEQEVCC